MKFIALLKSLVTFVPPPFLREMYHKHLAKEGHPEDPLVIGEPETYPGANRPTLPEEKSNLDKVWFDNVFRFWISVLTFLVCIGLHFAGVIPLLKPIFIIFALYIGLEILTTRMLLRTRYKRQLDFGLCSVDIISISVAIYFTGGSLSPLYFLYFIPFVVQAFHRDWKLLIYYGVGSIIGYGASILFTLDDFQFRNMAALGGRLFFMSLAVSTALIAVSFLRRQEKTNDIRLSRMRMLTQISQILNSMSSVKDLSDKVRHIVSILNGEFANQLNSWSRAFLSEDNDQTMRSIVNEKDNRTELKQELTMKSCPAATSNSFFSLQDSEKEEGCPTESFSFGSHLCVPISGTGNETYGVIFTGAKKPNVFGDDEQEFLKFIGRSLGLSIQRLRRVEELQLSLEMDSCAMATYLSSTKGLRETYITLLDGIISILKLDGASLMIWDTKKGELQTVESVGPFATQEKELKFHMGEGIPGRVFESGKSEWTTDAQKIPQINHNEFSFSGYMCLPLQNIKGESIGVINAWHINGSRFPSSYEVDIASTFATRATLAIMNAQLHFNKKPDNAAFGESPEEKAA